MSLERAHHRALLADADGRGHRGAGHAVGIDHVSPGTQRVERLQLTGFDLLFEQEFAVLLDNFLFAHHLQLVGVASHADPLLQDHVHVGRGDRLRGRRDAFRSGGRQRRQRVVATETSRVGVVFAEVVDAAHFLQDFSRQNTSEQLGNRRYAYARCAGDKSIVSHVYSILRSRRTCSTPASQAAAALVSWVFRAGTRELFGTAAAL